MQESAEAVNNDIEILAKVGRVVGGPSSIAKSGAVEIMPNSTNPKRNIATVKRRKMIPPSLKLTDM